MRHAETFTRKNLFQAVLIYSDDRKDTNEFDHYEPIRVCTREQCRWKHFGLIKT